MATATQLMPSPTQAIKSAFSPYTESPSSPAPFSAHFPGSNRSSGAKPSENLHPPPSPYPAQIEPSPVDSAGTGSTDIEEDTLSDGELSDFKSPVDEVTSPLSVDSRGEKLSKLDTSVRVRSNSDEAPTSVIHAPPGFKNFEGKRSPTSNRMSSSPATERSENTVVSPSTPEPQGTIEDKRPLSGAFTSPINTSVPASRDRPTPRAQTRQEAEEEFKRRSRLSKNLEDIPEMVDDGEKAEPSITDDDDGSAAETTQTIDEAIQDLEIAEKEVDSLKTALSECWTLCNTLATLSASHRTRMFTFSGNGETEQSAWRACWKLCQRLYENRNEDHAAQVEPTLELCREFCQALFEVRQRSDEAADSVLRVSFELNNHLYNTRDRNLPDAFRERTLDFYLTLCHRLMKQRTSLPPETDSLLRACWSLAELLFSLRQNNRDRKPPDEELLGSAVQACWELCDLFREGWTRVRPDRDRSTPRVGAYPFHSGGSQTSRSERSSSLANSSYHSAPSTVPETPTTIFDDREEMSPDEPVPNILVLGPESGATRTHNRWSSASSNISTFSEASQRTSSTATVGREDQSIARIKALILKAALNAGYARSAAHPLPAFVKALPSNSFGGAPWQTGLLQQYRKLVMADPTLREAHRLPSRPYSAAEVARAVQWMGRSEQFAWLHDLYRLVFGFLPEDAGQRIGSAMQT